MAAKKELTMKDLIAKKGTPKPVAWQVPKNLRSKIVADLDAILDAKAAGHVTPGHRQISQFFTERYSYHVAQSTIAAWLLKRTEERNGQAKEKR